MSGWIKFHRKILAWEWYDDSNTFRLFMHILLKSNHKERKYRGVLIGVGQLMTGQDLLAIETGLSRQQVRTSLKKLKSTNEITINSTSLGTIIQVIKYKDYQQSTNEATNDQPIVNQRPTNDQPTTNQRSTTNKNPKNPKNENNEIKTFELFWNLYNKKSSNRKMCMRKWSKLNETKRGLIMNHLVSYIKSTPDKEFRKNAETYLNQEHWLNEILQVEKKGRFPNNYDKDFERKLVGKDTQEYHAHLRSLGWTSTYHPVGGTTWRKLNKAV